MQADPARNQYGDHMVDDTSWEEQAWERPIGRLSDEAIREYKEIYKAEFGVELSDAEAEEQGLRLLRLFSILSRPLPDKSDPQGRLDSCPLLYHLHGW